MQRVRRRMRGARLRGVLAGDGQLHGPWPRECCADLLVAVLHYDRVQRVQYGRALAGRLYVCDRLEPYITKFIDKHKIIMAV